MRIAYCGYDFFYTCLDGLLEEGHELVELFTWPTDNEYDFNEQVLRIAQSKKARITLSPINKVDLVRLHDSRVDLLISAAYPYKIPDWTPFLRYALNVHPSLLPEGRGPWPLPWVIIKDLPESGVTIHEINQSWDGGDIIAQEKFSVSATETLESLSLRCQMVAERLTRRTVGGIEGFWAKKEKQNGPGSYWKMPKATDRTIDWNESVETIERLVRAFSKFEAFLYINGTRYFVRNVAAWKTETFLEAGTLAHRSNRELVFAAKDGFVALSNYVKAEQV